MPDTHLQETEDDKTEGPLTFANRTWNPRTDSVESYVAAINLKLRQSRTVKVPQPPTHH